MAGQRMEADRYEKHHLSYIAGLVCLLASLGLFGFILYIFPNVIFGWHYDVPGVVIDTAAKLQEYYYFSKVRASWTILASLFIPAGVLFVIADILSNEIDRSIYGIPSKLRAKKLQQATRSEEQKTGSDHLFLKIIMVIIVIFLVLEGLQWLISGTQSSTISMATKK